MRLFVAVDLDAVLRRELEPLIARARSVIGDRARLTWVTPERAHITLHFIGETPADEANALASLLSKPYATPPFELALGGLGVFPGRSRPRIIWLGVVRGAEPLAALAEEVGARLVQAGRPIDPRPFTAHLTLARVRDRLPVAALGGLESIGRGALGSTRVDRVTLFESRAGANGPAYVPLASGRCTE